MPVPKSVVKISKNGVEYTSEVDKCNYYMFELSRAALRDVGKYVRKRFRQEYYKHFQRHTGDGGNATKCKVFSNKNTIYPRIQMGLMRGKEKSFYAYFQEFGSKKHKKLGLLTKIVEGERAEIVKIESQYLSALEDEAKALALIDEEEYEESGDFE